MINKLQNLDFTLVLSGGGALGIAHLGVLNNLENKHLVPAEIVGTSMGGIIGACLSIGMREDEIYIYLKNFSSISKWISFSLNGNAIVDNDKIEEMFENIFQDKKMADTLIPLKLIATNIHNGKKKVFTKSDDVYIKDALLASMAIPGIFKEHIIQGSTYADGFLCENLGVNEASCDNILAVDVLGTGSFDQALPDNFFKTSNVFEMFEKSMRLLIYNQTRTHIKHCHKNILLLEPLTKKYKTYHFHKVDEIRELGKNLLK